MAKFPVILCVTLQACFISEAQKLKNVDGQCGLYYHSMNDLYGQQSRQLAFYKFQPGQVIASIGAQCCNWEAAYAATTDSMRVYLEDIDSTYLNYHQAALAWAYYARLRGRTMTTDYELVLGDCKGTGLPNLAFDKILIINSFHEFSHQKEMLADIRSKLKPEGVLYIEETLARRSGELHRACHKRIYLNEELISILRSCGYQYVDGLTLSYRKAKAVQKIFAFKKINGE